KTPEVAAHTQSTGKPAIKAAVHPAVPQGLQLPATRASVKDSPIILQPELLPQTAPLPTALPPLAFWARQAPDLPKPRPRQVVVPGRTEAPSPAPSPVGPPTPAVPNRETAVADVNIAMPQTQAQAPPALPVPNTATVPVRLQGVTEPRTASFEALPGEPVNIIALAAERTNARNVEIPRGLQNIPASAAGDGAAPGTERDRSHGEAVGAAPGTERDRSHGQAVDGSRQSPKQSAGVSAAPQTASASSQVASTPSRVAGAPASVANAPTSVGGAPPRVPSAPEVIRIQHP